MATTPAPPAGPISQHKRMAMGQKVDGKTLPPAPAKSKTPA